MQSRTSEKQFKKDLIKHLNKYNSGWIDGDKEDGRENENKVDAVNHRLKICIEIKDDKAFMEPTSKCWTGKFESKQVYNQLRRYPRSSKKFANYKGYKSLVMVRTDKANWPIEDMISYIIGGKNNFPKNIGGLLLCGKTRSRFFRIPNVSKERMVAYEWLEIVFPEVTEKNRPGRLESIDLEKSLITLL